MQVALNPRAVTAPGGKTYLFVAEKSGALPAQYMLVATKAGHKVAIRITGGCKNMTDADKADMMAVFETAFNGYGGVLMSGGTRQLTKDGSLDPMVTDIPGAVALANPASIALGSMPRTDTLTLQDESALVLDGYNTLPNPSMSALLMVQDGPDAKLDWDGDLPMYFSIMESWAKFGDFTALGVIAWNGGDVTKVEILEAAKRGWMTVLMEGSGRAADEFIGLMRSSDPSCPTQLKGGNVVIVRKDDATDLRRVLVEHGFLKVG